MNDLISRHAVIDALHIRFADGFDEDRWWNSTHVLAAIEGAPSVQHWIPCSQRLPKEDGEYLVTYEKGYAEDYGFEPIGIAPFEVDCEGFGVWQEEFDRYTLGSLGSEWVDIPVTAWMPLPESYKEDNLE